MKARNLAALAAGLILGVPGSAQADVFNGRISFSSFRVDPPSRTGDIFTMNNDGSDLRRLTTNPADDAQSDWAPDGRDIAYRIRKPDSRINFEVSRMTASGQGITKLTDTPLGQASSQPTWYPDRCASCWLRTTTGAPSRRCSTCRASSTRAPRGRRTARGSGSSPPPTSPAATPKATGRSG